MRTPSTPAAAFDAMSSTSSTRMSEPGEEAREPLRQQRHHLRRRVHQLVERARDRRAPGDPVDDLGEVLGQIEVGGPAIAGQAGGPPVELDGVMIEVARPDRRQHARRGRERVAGVAQEHLDGVVARHRRLELAKPNAGRRRCPPGRGTRAAAARAPCPRRTPARPPRPRTARAARGSDAAPPGSAPRRRAGARWCAAKASSPPRPIPTRVPGGTEKVIQALPPTTAPRPITVLPPRMVALA